VAPVGIYLKLGEKEGPKLVKENKRKNTFGGREGIKRQRKKRRK